MKEFDVNKRYIFDLTTALNDKILKANYDSGNAKFWADYCNGKEVTIEDELEGHIATPIKECFIMPWWCKEIK